MPENGQFRTGPPHTAEETLSLRGSGRSWSVALVTVAELEEEDGAGEHQGGAVGDDDRQFALPEAVGQPQAEAGDEHQEHPERNVLGRMGAPDAKHLGHEGEGGAEGGGVAYPVEEGHRWFLCRKLLQTPSSWQGSVGLFLRGAHKSFTTRRWSARRPRYRLRPKTGRHGSCSASGGISGAGLAHLLHRQRRKTRIMDDIEAVLQAALGLSETSKELGIVQMALRAVVVYVATVLIVRLGKKRFMGQSTAFDVILGIMLGSIVSRAVTGNAPFVPARAAAAVLLAMHWVFSALAFRAHRFGEAIKGEPRLLVREGQIDWAALRSAHMTEHGLWEDLRGKGGDRSQARG